MMAIYPQSFVWFYSGMSNSFVFRCFTSYLFAIPIKPRYIGLITHFSCRKVCFQRIFASLVTLVKGVFVRNATRASNMSAALTGCIMNPIKSDLVYFITIFDFIHFKPYKLIFFRSKSFAYSSDFKYVW